MASTAPNTPDDGRLFGWVRAERRVAGGMTREFRGGISGGSRRSWSLFIHGFAGLRFRLRCLQGKQMPEGVEKGFKKIAVEGVRAQKLDRQRRASR